MFATTHTTMDSDYRHSSPSSSPDSPRPSTTRQRSNSMPAGVMEALGCSTPEAELILREGRAAVHRRRASGGRGRRFDQDEDVYRPKDHLKFLRPSTSSSGFREDSMSAEDRKTIRHSRFPSTASNLTDSSITTVIPVDSTAAPKNILVNYSANLAKFIQSQLSSIPSYNTAQLPISPCSCPEFSYPSRTPPLSPTRSIRRPFDVPNIIAIPPVRPPMVSAFSEWSSTDDETDDEPPPLPTSASAKPYTPSPLSYTGNNSSFLFTSTPLEDDLDTARAFTFPNQSELPGSQLDSPASLPLASPPEEYAHQDWPLQSEETNPSQSGSTSLHSSAYHSGANSFTSSSAPSFTSVSTAEYFDFKLNPKMRARIIAAVTPPPGAPMRKQIIPAISPFDGAALSNVHDVLIESQQRVCVDGMCFDMLREFNLPDESMASGVGGMGLGSRRVGTPC